jgi:hypothetical protein
MFFFQNLLLFHLLTYATHNYDTLQVYPVYIHFLNHQLNQVPEFLKSRKDVGIVLQKQFENLSIDRRYIKVGLYFDGVLHFTKIDLTTIYLVEIENTCKIKFDNRLKYHNNHIKEALHLNELEYLNKVSVIEQTILKYGGEPINNTADNYEEKVNKTKIIDISEIINTSENYIE